MIASHLLFCAVYPEMRNFCGLGMVSGMNGGLERGGEYTVFAVVQGIRGRN